MKLIFLGLVNRYSCAMALPRTILIFMMSSSLSLVAQAQPLQSRLQELSARSNGRLGVCVLADGELTPVCLRGHEMFPLQSVMKLVVAASVLDSIDRNEARLEDEIIVQSSDISPGPEEFAAVVTRSGGYTATLGELLRRAIVDSDSTSVDVLLDRIGGISVVKNFINRKAISEVRIDRNERDLQSQSVGLSWKPEYFDLRKFENAVKSMPDDRRDQAWRAHSIDIRDKATPLGMVGFLRALIEGKLLSPSSTEELLSIMSQTATGNDRLRAGMPAGWKIAHKTGTGRAWKGETETMNDVGIITAPDGTRIALAVFLAGSKASVAVQASAIAGVAQLVCEYYAPKKSSRGAEDATSVRNRVGF